MVSLLRRMIASEDAKNPLQARKQKGMQGYGLCYIRLKEGDEIGWSGEFAETQVQRPSDQFLSIARVHSLILPPLERLERREEPEAQGGEFVEADDCK